MTRLLAALASAVGHHVRVRFLPSDADGITTGELWRQAEATSKRPGFDGPVAVQLESTADALVVLLATWIAGGTVVSLPAPARSASERYWESVERDAALAGATGIVCSPKLRSTAPPTARVVTFEDAIVGGVTAGRRVASDASFVQFTSGSTGDPKGVALSSAAILANTTAAIARLGAEPGDNVCSWLPLSHDMGIFGMCLPAMVGLGGLRNGGDLVLLSTGLFRVTPGRWFTACETYSATVTAAPPSVLQLLTNVLKGRGGSYDLRTLRAMVVGAEPIDPSVLRSFETTYATAGLAPTALCPAYGLAECTVAVSLDSPEARWRTVTDSGGVERVACGAPLTGMRVWTTEAQTLGIEGESLLSGTIGANGYEPHSGPLVTADCGEVVEGMVCVRGRADDVVITGGRNVHPIDVESAVPLDRYQLVAVTAIKIAEDRFSVVCETRRPVTDAAEVVRREISSLVSSAVGVTPREVVLVRHGSVPRTPSGKPRRSALAAQLAADGLAERQIS